MDFSEQYRCSLPPAFSPDGVYVAAAVEYRLVIREVESLKVCVGGLQRPSGRGRGARAPALTEPEPPGRPPPARGAWPLPLPRARASERAKRAAAPSQPNPTPDRADVYHDPTSQVVQIYSCLDKIHRVEWAASARYVLCGLYGRATAQVRAAERARGRQAGPADGCAGFAAGALPGARRVCRCSRRSGRRQDWHCD